jgi:hypothetical protein
MLPSVATLSNNILALTPSASITSAIPLFVAVIADWTNQLQAGSGGTPGIFTFGNAAMIALLETQAPVADSSWIANFASAWEAGITTGVITPSTVTNSAWAGSGDVDSQTSPSPASTIATIPAATAVLMAELANVVPDDTAPMALATAINAATLALSFTCIGLSAPPVFAPIPLTFPAQ